MSSSETTSCAPLERYTSRDGDVQHSSSEGACTGDLQVHVSLTAAIEKRAPEEADSQRGCTRGAHSSPPHCELESGTQPVVPATQSSADLSHTRSNDGVLAAAASCVTKTDCPLQLTGVINQRLQAFRQDTDTEKRLKELFNNTKSSTAKENLLLSLR